MQPFRTRVFNSAKVAATSLPPGARAAAIDYAGLGIPDTHHQRRRTGTTAFIGLAQGLPIHRDDAPGSAEIQTVADRTDKAGERLGEFGGVEQAEHPAETIMAGRTM